MLLDGVAELWELGELQAYLDEESNGRTLSQRCDLEHLHAVFDAEYECPCHALVYDLWTWLQSSSWVNQGRAT